MYICVVCVQAAHTDFDAKTYSINSTPSHSQTCLKFQCDDDLNA